MSESPDSRDYGRFDELAEEFAERYRRGERPSLQEYVDRLPEMADEIREMFPALVEVEQVEESRARCGAPQPPAAPRLRQVGDYRILREVGHGGMGVVYEAEQMSLGRRVALKVLPGHVAGDRKALERFRREAKAAARLHHTNIVPVFEVGDDGDVAFYAMQFIQGQGLDQVIDELAAAARSAGASSAGRRPRRVGAPTRNPSSALPPRAAAASDVRNPTLGQVAESLLSGRLRPERARFSDRRPPWPRPGGRGPTPTRPRSSNAPKPGRPSSRDSTRGRRVELGGAARRHRGLDGRVVRTSAAVLPERGADRPPGGAGAGLRALPAASSTATSSRRTCSWTPRESSGSPTSAWPRPRKTA